MNDETGDTEETDVPEPAEAIGDADGSNELGDAEEDGAQAAAEQPAKPRRFRPLLLFVLLLAVIAFVFYRAGLRRDAMASAKNAIVGTLHLSARDLYALRLRVAGLDDSALGKRWRSAVARSNSRAVEMTGTYQTRGRFNADHIEAKVYTTELERGERLQWRLTRTPAGHGELFASLEYRQGENDWASVAWLNADGRAHTRAINRNGTYRFVLQPELAADPGYRLAVASGGSLSFPVDGASMHDIGSGFNAPREGGRRKHHGVDIFADRGTPVRAVVAGRVRTGTAGIGGNHVWLASGMLGLGGARYYYAHLDSFAVKSNSWVVKGDVLGRVGNTGNARTTPPHLHFGIYVASGPLDPAPFLRPPPELPAPPASKPKPEQPEPKPKPETKPEPAPKTQPEPQPQPQQNTEPKPPDTRKPQEPADQSAAQGKS